MSKSIDWHCNALKTEGWTKIKLPLPLRLISHTHQLLIELIQEHPLYPEVEMGDNQNLSNLIIATQHYNRKILADIYDAFRESSLFQQIISHPSLINIIQKILNTRYICNPFQHSVFRMDLPSEDNFLFNWHQDLPYNMLGAGYITLWMPLLDTNLDSKSLFIVPNSHQEVYPTLIEETRDLDGKEKGTWNCFIDPNLYRKFEHNKLEIKVEAQEAVIFDSRLVHRSVPLQEKGVRLSIQARYGDFFTSDYKQRHYQNRRHLDFKLFQNIFQGLTE